MDQLAEEQQTRFSRLYRRDAAAYGDDPSPEVLRFIDQCLPGPGRPALDVGAGPGRNTLALARRGFNVTAIDLAAPGLEQLATQARREGLADRVRVETADIRTRVYAPSSYDVIVAATSLDHIPRQDSRALLSALAAALRPEGVLYVEVHTTEDPGAPAGAGSRSDAPVSETAAAIQHYFEPNELLQLAARRLRVLRYEERVEWDETHGQPHQHGKAVLLGVRWLAHPRYFGATAPRPPEASA